MRKLLLYIISVPCLFLLFIQPACNPVECFKRTGNIVKEERIVKDFTSIIVMDNIRVLLRNDNSNKIIVEAGSNLVKSVKTEVEGDILKINNENACNWARSYKNQITVSVGAKSLQNLEQLGFKEITTIDTLETPGLVVSCRSSGDISLNIKTNALSIFSATSSYINVAGKTRTLRINSNGIGEIFTQELRADNVTIQHENINQVHVYPIKSLNVTFFPQNTGNVIYYNQPDSIKVTKKGTPKGAVIKK